VEILKKLKTEKIYILKVILDKMVTIVFHGMIEHKRCPEHGYTLMWDDERNVGVCIYCGKEIEIDDEVVESD